MENRRPVLCVVPFQTLGVSPSGGPTAVGEADLNLTDPQGRQHILDGDSRQVAVVIDRARDSRKE